MRIPHGEAGQCLMRALVIGAPKQHRSTIRCGDRLVQLGAVVSAVLRILSVAATRNLRSLTNSL